jgi:hypothetical protein
MRWVRLLMVLLVVAEAEVALACPACSCGNPTLTTMGIDQPFADRVRVGLSGRAWAVSQPEGRSQQQVRELRFDLSASWAPSPWLQLYVNLPLQLRELESANLARQRAVGPGAVDVSARVVVLRERRMRPRYLVGASVGLQLPSSPVIVDRGGVPLDVDAQLSLGGWTPHGAVSMLSFLSSRWALFGSAGVELPFGAPRLGVQGAPSLTALVAAQVQPAPWLAARLGMEGRYDTPRLVGGKRDDIGAGPSLFAAPDLLLTLGSQWVLQAGVRWPVASALGGAVQPGPVVLVAVVTDV